MEKRIKEALERLVFIARQAKQIDAMFTEMGYNDTPWFETYGQAMDAIYVLIGEDTGTLDESVTYDAVRGEEYTDDQRIKLLMDEYRKNRPAQ